MHDNSIFIQVLDKKATSASPTQQLAFSCKHYLEKMHKSIIIALSKLLYWNKLTWRAKSNAKVLYLTFDDGPDPDITPQVLKILEIFNVKATFFCLGEKAKTHKEPFNRILSCGHAIGNHGYRHLSGWRTSTKKYVQNALKTSTVFKTNLFRPPYGRITPLQAFKISKHYNIIMWSLMSRDYSKKITPGTCLDKLFKRIKPGDIIVFHDSKQAAGTCLFALPGFIEYAKAEGYEFKVLDASLV